MSTRKKTAASTARVMASRKTGRQVVARGTDAAGRRRWLPIAVVGAAVVVFVVLVVVSSQRSASHNAASAAVVAASGSPGGTDVGGQVPPIRLTSINGTRVSVPAGRPWALFFSASYCQPCVPSSIALGQLKRHWGDRIDVNWISIDPSDSVGGVQGFRQGVGNPPYSSSTSCPGWRSRSARGSWLSAFRCSPGATSG